MKNEKLQPGVLKTRRHQQAAQEKQAYRGLQSPRRGPAPWPNLGYSLQAFRAKERRNIQKEAKQELKGKCLRDEWRRDEEKRVKGNKKRGM